MAERQVISGEPGTTWVNDSDRVIYQFVASLRNTCGACLQWHMRIGSWWGIPLHWGCGGAGGCHQIAIRPGTEAPHAFADFREILDNMSYADQRAAIGNSNYALLKAKVVSWGEIVTKYRVRTLREVIAINKVSFETAVRAGVPKRAYIAWGTQGEGAAGQAGVHAPAAEVIRAERKRLIESIKGAGVSQEALVDSLTRGLTSRVRLVAPGVDQSMAPLVARRGPDLLAAELAALAARHAVFVPGANIVTVKIKGDRVTIIDAAGRVNVVLPGGSAFGRSYKELRRLGPGRKVF